MQVFKLVLTNYTGTLKSGLGLEVSGGVIHINFVYLVQSIESDLK